ncbi:MAG: tRNA lysidine(34) synthetase TilS [Candidatus Cloacimonas sp.]|jgi:tRNA(Ile)-lysidine synthase|nr:tRNA lysidine(34) synthetase TilS [Candidatus Cloacimonas sp.]
MIEIAEALKRLTGDIERKGLINKGDKVILACSGGADSTAMLYLFSRLRHSLNVSLLAVHVNHQLRGEASIDEAELVKQQCQNLNVPLIMRKINVPSTGNLENQARKLRFEVFEQVLNNYGFSKILLAHHQDDQAETMLLNLFRGSGIGGMAGIKPISGIIVHPMLGFTKCELEEILSKAALPWCTDASNEDNSFSRNRLRNDLLPKLKIDYNPAIVERLSHQGEIFNQADKILRERAKGQFKRIVLDSSSQRIMMDIPALIKLRAVERYYIYRMAFCHITKQESDFMGAHSEAIDDILESRGSKQLALSQGVQVKKIYADLFFYGKEEGDAPEAEALEINSDRSRAVYGNYRFSFKYLRVFPKEPEIALPDHYVLLDADKIALPFSVRYRKPGDKFIPFGMKHFKRLKEFFIDEKVPKYDRGLIPIFDDGSKLFWIVGHRIDDRVRYDEATTHYLQIVAEPILTKPNRAANRKKA